MRAILIAEFKDVSEGDSLSRMIVWRLPVPVPPRAQGF
jgi:hypothetical protein